MRYFIVISIFLGIYSCGNSTEEKNLSTKTEIVTKRALKLIQNKDSSRYNVAFYIMDGIYNTELTAPYDILQHTFNRKNQKSININ